MSELTKLQVAALRRFALDGFAGASMSAIALGAGIRKSSIYAHFPSKEDLFLSLLQPVMEAERDFLENGLGAAGSAEPLGPLRLYLGSFADRLNEDPPRLRFLLRALYLPPEAIKNMVAEAGARHYAALWSVVDRKIAELNVKTEEAPDLSTAYIGIMDSVHTALLYAPDFAADRLKCLWTMFTKALPCSRGE